MRRMVGGREIDIPEDPDGLVDVQDLRETLDVTPSETLIEQTTAGENFMLPMKGHMMLNPASQFIAAPLIERGVKHQMQKLMTGRHRSTVRMHRQVGQHERPAFPCF
ncbi:hypothetical protein ACFL34_05375 [Candidatus Sumerlaeota bacterium]